MEINVNMDALCKYGSHLENANIRFSYMREILYKDALIVLYDICFGIMNEYLQLYNYTGIYTRIN